MCRWCCPAFLWAPPPASHFFFKAACCLGLGSKSKPWLGVLDACWAGRSTFTSFFVILALSASKPFWLFLAYFLQAYPCCFFSYPFLKGMVQKKQKCPNQQCSAPLSPGVPKKALDGLISKMAADRNMLPHGLNQQLTVESFEGASVLMVGSCW